MQRGLHTIPDSRSPQPCDVCPNVQSILVGGSNARRERCSGLCEITQEGTPLCSCVFWEDFMEEVTLMDE